MEINFENIADITYMSELIPADSFCIRKSESKRRGLIRPSLRSRTRLDDSEQSEESRTIAYSHLRVPACRQAGVSYVLIKYG